MLSALASLRRRLALAIAPDLVPQPALDDGPRPVFRSVRTASTESRLSTPAARIAVFRRSIGMSQRGFADLLGVLPRTISHIESGRRGPSRSLLVAMATQFDLSADWVLTGTGPSPFPPRPRSAPPHPKA